MREAFDDLSKALASGMSRRAALRRFGVVALGTAVAVFRPGRALAGTPDFRTLELCEEFCEYLYHGYNRAAKACMKDAFIYHRGACFEFGPASRCCSNVRCPHDSFCVSGSFNGTGASTVGPTLCDTICVPI
jgi:hypothetical protein